MIGKPKRLKKSQKSLNGKTDKKNSLSRKVLHYVLAAGFVFAPWLGGEAYAADNGIVRVEGIPSDLQQTYLTDASDTVANIYAEQASGTVGLNRFQTFNVDNGQIANLYFKPYNSDNVLDTLVNTVENQINISGVVNGIRNNTIDGNLYFISPQGMVVGSTGVINAGSLTMIASSTPVESAADAASKIGNFRNCLLNDASINIQGQINTATGIDLRSLNIAISKDAESSIVPHLKTGMIFNEIVNTDGSTTYGVDPDQSLIAIDNDNGIKLSAYQYINNDEKFLGDITLNGCDVDALNNIEVTSGNSVAITNGTKIKSKNDIEFDLEHTDTEGKYAGALTFDSGNIEAGGFSNIKVGKTITIGKNAQIISNTCSEETTNITTSEGKIKNDGIIKTKNPTNIRAGADIGSQADANIINQGTISSDDTLSIAADNSVLNLGTIEGSGQISFGVGNTMINTGEIISENSNVQAHIGRNFCNISHKSDLYKSALDDFYVEIVPANGVPECIINAIPDNTDPADPFTAKIQANGNVQVDYALPIGLHPDSQAGTSGIYNSGTIKATGDEDPIIGSDGEMNLSSGSGNIWLTSSYNIVNDDTMDAGRQITLNARDQLINRGTIQGVSYLDIKSIMGSVHNCDSGEIIVTNGYIDLSTGQENLIIQGDRSYLDFTSLVLEGTIKADAGISDEKERGNINITAHLDDIYIDGATIESTDDVILNAGRNIAIGYQTERARQDDPTTQGPGYDDNPNEREYFKIKKNEDTGTPVPSTKTATISGSNIILIAGGANPTDKQAESEGRAAGELNINGTLSATAGNVEINADKDKIIIDGGSISATGGDVNITASKNDVVINSGTVSSANGDIQLTAGDTVNITGGELSAANTLSMNGKAVNISKDIQSGSIEITSPALDFGTHKIAATAGSVKLTDTQDESEGDAADELKITGTISAKGGNVEINADKDKIIVDGGSISATGGDVNINASENDVVINSGTISATGGNVEINAAKGITVNNNAETGKNGEIVANAGNSDGRSGNIHLTADNTVDITGGKVYADDTLSINGIEGVTLSGSNTVVDAGKNLSITSDNYVTDSRGDKKPVDDSGDKKPVDGSGDKKPADGSGDKKPVDGSDDKKPVDGSDDKKPVDGSDDKKPIIGNDSVNPVNMSAQLLNYQPQNTSTAVFGNTFNMSAAPVASIEMPERPASDVSPLPQDDKKVVKQDENGLNIEDEEE